MEATCTVAENCVGILAAALVRVWRPYIAKIPCHPDQKVGNDMLKERVSLHWDSLMQPPELQLLSTKESLKHRCCTKSKFCC